MSAKDVADFINRSGSSRVMVEVVYPEIGVRRGPMPVFFAASDGSRLATVVAAGGLPYSVLRSHVTESLPVPEGQMAVAIDGTWDAHYLLFRPSADDEERATWSATADEIDGFDDRYTAECEQATASMAAAPASESNLQPFWFARWLKDDLAENNVIPYGVLMPDEDDVVTAYPFPGRAGAGSHWHGYGFKGKDGLRKAAKRGGVQHYIDDPERAMAPSRQEAVERALYAVAKDYYADTGRSLYPMNLEQLKKAASSLAVSSDFRYGDPTTFSVTLLEHEVELPGPADPAKYLDMLKRKLKVELHEGDEVAIVCPGNGGLVAEVVRAGAKRVVAIEPRPRFGNAIERVCAMLNGAYEGGDIKTYRGWPGANTDIGPFDLVIWPEGVDECRDPVTTLESLAGMIRAEPRGMVCVEVAHGDHTRIEPPLNAFFPKPETWFAVLDGIGGEVLETAGRTTNRTIYRVADDAGARPQKAKEAEVPKKKEELAPEPGPAEVPPAPPPPPPAPKEEAKPKPKPTKAAAKPVKPKDAKPVEPVEPAKPVVPKPETPAADGGE